ncbi:MAG: hypothetical protein PVI01_04810 [Gemmatimonadales bacterium]|jgi:hypothetical protein
MKLEARLLLCTIATVALPAVLACPIQRSPVPREYLPFRAKLEDAVTDTALVEMEGLPRMQSQLESQLTNLAAILTVDSLLAALEADRELAPLAGAIATTVRIELESKGVDGGVRKAFRNRDGQRQAVDAIVIGLGRALYRLHTSSMRRTRRLRHFASGWGPLVSSNGCVAKPPRRRGAGVRPLA